jgi:hypothetical protein
VSPQHSAGKLVGLVWSQVVSMGPSHLCGLRASARACVWGAKGAHLKTMSRPWRPISKSWGRLMVSKHRRMATWTLHCDKKGGGHMVGGFKGGARSSLG